MTSKCNFECIVIRLLLYELKYIKITQRTIKLKRFGTCFPKTPFFKNRRFFELYIKNKKYLHSPNFYINSNCIPMKVGILHTKTVVYIYAPLALLGESLDIYKLLKQWAAPNSISAFNVKSLSHMIYYCS